LNATLSYTSLQYDNICLTSQKILFCFVHSNDHHSSPALKGMGYSGWKIIKVLLKWLKYEDHEIGFFSSEKRKTNQTLSVIEEVFEERLKEISNHDFLLTTTPLLYVTIHRGKGLTIQPSKALCFYKTFIDLVNKCSKELQRLKKENQNTVNVENNIEDHNN
jgi:hypothetical protein